MWLRRFWASVPLGKSQSRRCAPIEVDISKIEAGQLMTVEWQGKPIRCSTARSADKEHSRSRWRNGRPLFRCRSSARILCKNELRSIKDNIFVVIGICTHFELLADLRPDVAPAIWAQAGKATFLPCHGSKYGLGRPRVFEGARATNLIVPPYKYLTDATILVGDDK